MKSVSRSRKQSSFRPELECLEDRLQPSGPQTAAADFAPVPLAQVSALSHHAHESNQHCRHD
jgi:hypothetical protein